MKFVKMLNVWNLNTMDNLSLSFSASFDKEKFKRAVQDADQIEDLKLVTCQLIDSFYTQREFIRSLMEKSLHQF